MLKTEDISRRIREGLAGVEKVSVNDYTGTGDHFEAQVVSTAFEGLSMVQQHQKVYGTLQAWMQTGELHALALKTYTPAQWKKLGMDASEEQR